MVAALVILVADPLTVALHGDSRIDSFTNFSRSLVARRANAANCPRLLDLRVGLDEPSVVRSHAQRDGRLGSPLGRWASPTPANALRRRWRAHIRLVAHHVRVTSMMRRRACRPSFGTGDGSRASAASRHARRHSPLQAGGVGASSRRLRPTLASSPGPVDGTALRRHGAQEHPRRGRHIDRQDDADECVACQISGHQRPHRTY
jgi:hypothetical protein